MIKRYSARGAFFAAIWTFFAFAALSPGAVLGDPPRSGFNHLEFDRPIVTTNPSGTPSGAPGGSPEGGSELSERDIQAIIEGGKAPNPGTANPGAAKDPGGASLRDAKVKKFDWVKPADGQGHYLTPRLRGPQVDVGHDSTITTQANWDKQSGGCDVSRADLLCQKAKALRELLTRFSGDEDFFTRQCKQKCDDANMDSILTTFRVKDRHGQAYDILQAGDKCRYQLGALPGRTPWLAMEGESGSCACLPKHCGE